MPEEQDIKREDQQTRDPVTEEPVSHLVGAGAGAVGGGAAGAAIGTAVGGPVGTVIGAVVGAVAGAYSGKAVAESIDPDAEDAHWRQKYQDEPYVDKTRPYDEYQPAYRTGFTGVEKYEPGTQFEEAEPTLREDYTAAQGPLPWEHAKPAAEAAWNRVLRGEAVRVPLSEEQLEVRKREVESGGVRLRKVIKTEVANRPVELKREEIVVERVSAAEATGGAAPAGAFKEEDIYIPLKEEEAVVEKTARKVGEVEIKKTEHTETQQVSGEVRREDVEVDEEGGDKVRRK
jgi:uncharacterized protein (TIGR02271 family)